MPMARDACLHGSLERRWEDATVLVPAVYKEWATPGGSLQPPRWLTEFFPVYLFQRIQPNASCYCPNHGYEAGVLLTFVVLHYQRLPGHIVFVQPDWLPEQPSANSLWMLACVRSGKAWRDWLPLGRSHNSWPPHQVVRQAQYFDEYWTRYKRTALSTSACKKTSLLVDRCWRDTLRRFHINSSSPNGLWQPLNLTYWPSANFVVSRSRLLEHDRATYEVALDFVFRGVCLEAPLTVRERLAIVGSRQDYILEDDARLEKFTNAMAFEMLNHVLFGRQPVEHAPPLAFPVGAECERVVLSSRKSCGAWHHCGLPGMPARAPSNLPPRICAEGARHPAARPRSQDSENT